MAEPTNQADIRCQDHGNDNPVVEMRGIKKAFGAIQAVAHADLKLYKGEIHALVGGNGSGKSTLISVLSGANKTDAGEIYIDGEKVIIDDPKIAIDKGIKTLYQNLQLFELMNVTANLFAGRVILKPPPLSWFGFVDHEKMRSVAVEEFKRLKLDIPDVDMRVIYLSGGQRQGIACARAMMGTTPKVLIMDEPTAALGVGESREIYRLMEVCRDEGAAIVLISHDMVEVMEVSNRITVMRLGETIAHLNTSETSGKEIVGLITGAIEPWEVEGKRR
jgi:simple sugar transport system ATP-binding protein